MRTALQKRVLPYRKGRGNTHRTVTPGRIWATDIGAYRAVEGRVGAGNCSQRTARRSPTHLSVATRGLDLVWPKAGQQGVGTAAHGAPTTAPLGSHQASGSVPSTWVVWPPRDMWRHLEVTDGATDTHRVKARNGAQLSRCRERHQQPHTSRGAALQACFRPDDRPRDTEDRGSRR